MDRGDLVVKDRENSMFIRKNVDIGQNTIDYITFKEMDHKVMRNLSHFA